jgi:uncharacterized protein (TIGR02246 family)
LFDVKGKSPVQTTRATDEAEIRGLIDTFVSASVFAEDADFTAITGLRAQGRETIARGHDEILATIYRGSKLSGHVNDLRFLRPDVAVVDVTMTFIENAPFGLTQSRLGCVLTREADGWKIAVFRNMIPYSRPPAGPVEEGLDGTRTRGLRP